MIYQSKRTESTKKLAGQYASGLSGDDILCLYGPLGAGKTTFTTGIINYFLPGKRVLSPTFIIVRHYIVSAKKIKNIFHIDLYRLETTENWKSIGLDEILVIPESIVIIEWAERLGKHLPLKRTDIDFKISDKDTRIIQITHL